MPTQSLILRGQIGRRLSIAEMDGNFTYLETLAQEGGTVSSGSISIPENFIPVGTGNGLTSSSNLIFDITYNNLKSAPNSTIGTNSCQSSIIGGSYNTISENEGSVIIGGIGNNICCNSDFSAILGGVGNNICCNSQFSIISGSYNKICC
jgi:hypothetical protein